ncbi:MAG TPA: hypothetical protein VN636_05130, partial [Acidimicrobiia bacterium]|nr:hypothetical protein [Acidimicrobiia bacterium]
MDLGVLDRAQGLEDLGFSGHEGSSGLRRISTTSVGRISGMAADDLTADEFAAAVAAVTSAFGDPTRR